MEIFGIKTISLIDYWTIIHILSGIIIGFLLLKLQKEENANNKIIISNIIAILSLAFAWEIIEYLGEIGVFGNIIKTWLYGIEYLPNRLIIDPLSILLGFFIVLKKPKVFTPATVLCSIWVIIHIFLFKSAVYLNQ